MLTQNANVLPWCEPFGQAIFYGHLAGVQLQIYLFGPNTG